MARPPTLRASRGRDETSGTRFGDPALTTAPASLSVPVEEALRRLDASLRELETALARRLDAERRRSDLEIELEVMQDDRARLAVELDGTAARLRRAETANADVGQRLAGAIATVEAVLAAEAEAR
jgi:hypothetical protein